MVIALGSAQAGRRIDLFGGRDVLAVIGRSNLPASSLSLLPPFING